MQNFHKDINTNLTPEKYSLCFAFNGPSVLLLKSNEDEPGIPTLESLYNANIDFSITEYFGKQDNITCFNAHLENTEILPENFYFENIRNTFHLIDAEHFGITSYAYHLSNWDASTQYCGKCGSKMERIENEKAKKCTSCDNMAYTKISPAIIVSILKDDKILLARNHSFRDKMYSVIAGFVDPGESLEDCLHREVKEELNIEVNNLKYFGSQPWPFPDSIMIGFVAHYKSGDIKLCDNELSDAGWFDKNNLPELPSKYSIARKMIDNYIAGTL